MPLRWSPRWGAVVLAGAAAGCGSSTTSPAAVAAVVSVAVSGSAPLVGATAQFSATATLSDGTSKPVTSAASWSSSNGGVAGVSASGVVTGVAAGDADITATYQSASGKEPV